MCELPLIPSCRRLLIDRLTIYGDSLHAINWCCESVIIQSPGDAPIQSSCQLLSVIVQARPSVSLSDLYVTSINVRLTFAVTVTHLLQTTLR